MAEEIRIAYPREYARLGEIAVLASRALGGFPEDHPYYARLADVAGRAEDNEILAAIVDGDLAGVATYVPGPDASMSEFSDADAAGIRMLAVDPRFQGRGLGKALATACLERARRAGRRRIILHSSQIQTRAQAMYRSMGFTRAATLDWSPEPGVLLSGFVYELGV